MRNNRIALLGSALAALLCGAGMAVAQDYGPYEGPANAYDDRPAPAEERVIVHPDYDYVEKRQLVGHINGEVNPQELSISRPVSFSDLDLSRDADFMELQDRVRDTARDLCFQLDARFPELRGDRSADRECIRTATRNAMHEVLEMAD